MGWCFTRAHHKPPAIVLHRNSAMGWEGEGDGILVFRHMGNIWETQSRHRAGTATLSKQNANNHKTKPGQLEPKVHN